MFWNKSSEALGSFSFLPLWRSRHRLCQSTSTSTHFWSSTKHYITKSYMFVCVNENMLNKQFCPNGIWIVCVFQIPSGQTVCLAYFHLHVQTIVTVLPGWNLMIVCFRRIYTCWLNVEGKICSQIKPEILCLLWIFRDRKERKFGIKL